MITEPSSPPGTVDVAIYGDSIAEGLGARGREYGSLLASIYGYTVRNRSRTGWTIRDSLHLMESQPVHARIVILAHGITEPIVRPRDQDLRFVVPRWRRRGWMDPRPYYSTSMQRRLLESIESSVRWRAKNVLVARLGSSQLLTRAEYISDLTDAVDFCTANRSRPIVLEPTAIDEKFFPGSSKAQADYLSAAVTSVPELETIPTRGLLTEWEDFLLDRFHPNAEGHAKIAQAIAARVGRLE